MKNERGKIGLTNKTETFDISVMTVHAGSLDLLKQCINSIKENTTIPYLQVIVADKPDDETLEYLKSLSEEGAKVATNPELIGGEAVNQALRMAEGKYLCLVSTDVLLSPGAIEAMREALERHPEFGWVALSSEYTGFFVGCSMLTREAFKKVGFIDTQFIFGFNDDDYLRRMWKEEYNPHIVTGVKVSHKGGATYNLLYDEEERKKRFLISQARFYKKHGQMGTDWDAFPKYQPFKDESAEIYGDKERPERLDASYYNEDYFKPGPKSSYNKPFTWELAGEESRRVAHSLKDTFSPKNALDVGCAKGFLCKALLEAGIDAYGCDISEFAVKNCEPEVKGRLKIADIRDGLPYPDSSFDLVCSFSTLEHVEMEFLPYVASEIARVAKKWVIINVPVTMGNENMPWGDPSHRTYMRVSYWISLFRNQGLYCDLRTSRQEGAPFPNAQVTFLKEESLNDGGKTMQTEQAKEEEMMEYPTKQGVHRLDWIRSKVSIVDTILEVACAENPIWAGSQFKVTTLDKSVRPEEQCFPDIVGEAESLPFAPNRFDIVSVGELLEHVPDPQVVLREAARVAKKKVIITCPDEYSWPDEFKPFWNPDHVRFYTYSTFQNELKKLGLPFKIWNVKFRGWSHWCAEIYCDGGKTMQTEQAKEEEMMEYPAKLKEVFESERYWHGDWGYRQGYQDFPIHEQVVELIQSRNPKRVLDVGCAMGFIVKRLREKGIDAYGVDISNYAISRAPEEVKPYLQVASAHDLSFPPQSFDLIYCASVLEHIPEAFTDKVIAEFKRVAKGAILGIAYKDPFSALDEHGDISHVNIKDELWWREKLPPEFEMIDVCVEDGKPYTRGLTKLNLGCFGDYYPSWINIDILPLREQLPPHIRFKQADLRRGLPFYADSSVDLVRMSHLIEHLTLEEAHNLCHEIYRVLKPGALARISTPDASVIIEYYSNGDMTYFNQIQPPEYIQAPTEGEKLSRLLFSGDYQHRAVYNFEMLKSFLEQAGFVEIERVSPGFSHSEVMRNETEDQHMKISLTIEAKKGLAPASGIEQFMKKKAEGKIPTSQPPSDVPEYWKGFATGDRMYDV